MNHRALTAAVIDSRDFLAAKRRAETEVMVPPGPKVAFTGGYECNDHQAIWAALDRVHAKHPGMVLLHGGSPKGAERIAACWADNRTVPQVAFKPDFTRHRNAAPFKRNDQMLDVLPIGVVVFPGSGIPTTSPTRPASSASRFSTTAREAGRKPRPDCGRSGNPQKRLHTESLLRHYVLLAEQRHSRHCGGTRRAK